VTSSSVWPAAVVVQRRRSSRWCWRSRTAEYVWRQKPPIRMSPRCLLPWHFTSTREVSRQAPVTPAPLAAKRRQGRPPVFHQPRRGTPIVWKRRGAVSWVHDRPRAPERRLECLEDLKRNPEAPVLGKPSDRSYKERYQRRSLR